MVYEDAEKYYAEVSKKGNDLLNKAIDALLQPKGALPFTPANVSSILKQTGQGKIVGVNTTPFRRRDILELPLVGGTIDHLKAEAVQISMDGKIGYALLQADAGLSVAQPRGMFADCNTVSGECTLFYI